MAQFERFLRCDQRLSAGLFSGNTKYCYMKDISCWQGNSKRIVSTWPVRKGVLVRMGTVQVTWRKRHEFIGLDLGYAVC